MATIQQQWDELPTDLRARIAQHTGTIHTVETAADGFNSELAATLHTDSGTLFVKGLRTDHPRAWTQEREATINPFVTAVAPRLLWQITAAGWHVNAFEYLPGRPADYGPDSKDLSLVVHAMTALGRIACPDVPVKEATQRWTAYLDDPADAHHLDGEALLHTDWNPTNVLITDTDTPARIVDWAWPTRGAAWIDPACWVIWLTAAGHTPHHAETWAAKVPTWTTAPPDALTLFARAQARLWHGIAEDAPDDWTRRLAHATEQWATYRGGA